MAAREGNQGAVMLLLTRDDIDSDKADNDGRTLLQCASTKGHVGVVRLLARDDVDPDKLDSNGRTPLSWASRIGHEEVVRLLSYSHGTMSIPTSQATMVKHHSGGRLTMGMRGW